MFRPVEMSKLNILVLSKYVTETTRLLGQMGKMHLIDAVSQSSGRLLKEAEAPADNAQIEKLSGLCARLVEGLGIDLDNNSEAPEEAGDDMSIDDMSALLNRIARKYGSQEAEIEKELKAAGVTDKERSAIAAFPLQNVPIEALRNLSHFYMVTGRMEPTAVARAMLTLGESAIIVQADGDAGNILVLSSNKDRFAVKDELDKYGFTEAKPPEEVDGTAHDAVANLSGQLEELRAKLEECKMKVLELAAEYGPVVRSIQQNLKCRQAVQDAQKHFGFIANVYCISGWAPSTEVEEIRQIVNTTTGGTGVVEVIRPEDDANVQEGKESVPVKFSGGAILRPFQALISNFGMPQYTELDPSVFVALTFVILFGFMFGDVGQGLVLVLAGLYMCRTKRKIAESFRDAGPLLIACGICATLFGFCYGSVFGYENHNFLKPLWLSPLKQDDIGKLLATAVGVGVIFSSVAIIINIINHFRAKRFFDGIFDRFGLLGLVFFWMVLGTGVWFLVKKTIPVVGIVLIVLPLVLLFFKGILAHYVFRLHREKESFLNIILEALIELMETFTGYLSGTVSFVRVGAFAISHAALCLAVYSIVGLMDNVPGGRLWSLIVIIFGNALVICFEGMVAMIQCVRLEYYELFGKYFSGGGIEYKPFKLKK